MFEPSRVTTRRGAPFASVDEAVAALRDGKMLIVLDDLDPRTGGDLIVAGRAARPEAINFMSKRTCGVICIALTHERCEALGLQPMAAGGEGAMGEELMVSVESRTGVSTGISAPDRARTIRAASAANPSKGDLVHPGHVFPIRAARGGVLERPRKTEAAIDLARYAGITPAVVKSQITNRDGSIAATDDLIEYGLRHGIGLVSVSDLVALRARHDPLVARLLSRVVDLHLPTAHVDNVSLLAYRSRIGSEYAVAIVKGHVAQEDGVIVSVPGAQIRGVGTAGSMPPQRQPLELSLRLMERVPEMVLLHFLESRAAAELVLNCLRKPVFAAEELVALLAESPGCIRDGAYGDAVTAQVLADLDILSASIVASAEVVIGSTGKRWLRLADNGTLRSRSEQSDGKAASLTGPIASREHNPVLPVGGRRGDHSRSPSGHRAAADRGF